MSGFKKAIPIILSCFAVIGTVATTVMAVRATPKARENRNRAELRKTKEAGMEIKEHPNSIRSVDGVALTAMEIIKAEAPAYLPAAAVGMGTVLCIFGAGALNLKQQASLTSAYALAERTYHRYKDKVKSLIGLEADRAAEEAVQQEENDILDDRPPWDEVQTFYIECGEWSTFFDRTMEQVKEAEYHINRNLNLKGRVSFNELLEFLELPPIAHGDDVGWNQDNGETTYGYLWIDFYHRWFSTDDGLSVCAIDMPFAPHPDEDPDG